MKELIHKISEDLRRDFEVNPYDYTSAEIEAQVRVFNALMQHVDGYIVIDRNDAIPPFVNLRSNRLRMEWGFNGKRHDIMILKSESTATSYEDVEAIIEIKIGWGFTESHLKDPKVIKDMEILGEHRSKAFLLFFLANNFQDMTIEQQAFYSKGLSQLKTDYNVLTGHMLLIFRDLILQ
jgi:hypothetical protein